MNKRILIPIALVIFAASAVFVALNGRSSETNEITPTANVEVMEIQTISPTDYVAEFVNGGQEHLLIDVRTPDEYNSGHIAGSVNINVDEIENRLNEIPQDGKPIVVYCRSGNRSSAAAEILEEAGYSIIYDLGSINDWVAQGLPIE